MDTSIVLLHILKGGIHGKVYGSVIFDGSTVWLCFEEERTQIQPLLSIRDRIEAS